MWCILHYIVPSKEMVKNKCLKTECKYLRASKKDVKPYRKRSHNKLKNVEDRKFRHSMKILAMKQNHEKI